MGARVPPQRDPNVEPKAATTQVGPKKEKELTSWQDVVIKKSKKKERKKTKDEIISGTGASNQKGTKKERPPRARPPRPDAIVIKAAEGRSYADILSKMKAAPSLGKLGDSVNKIRKTLAGDLLLELGRSKEVRTSDFQEAVRAVLGDGATTRALHQEETLEIRDLDMLTTKEDILEVLQREVGEEDVIEDTAIKSLRKAYGDTQIAVIRVSPSIASKFTKLGKIRIGWVNCRIRLYNREKRPLRCYKCLGFGHIAIKCTEPQNRSNCCYKCGKTGHKANSCRNELCCILCQGKGDNTQTKHVTGSYMCPAYQAAVKMNKRRK